MKLEELRANLESYNIESLTIQRLLVARDRAREKQMWLQNIREELYGYNTIIGYDYPTDEMRDCLNGCIEAVSAEADIYGAFVSQMTKEIYKRLEK